MRLVREISHEEENFRLEDAGLTTRGGSSIKVVKRDSVEPEPVGTIVLMAFRVTGYDSDCDRSLMARLEQVHIDGSGETTGWCPSRIGLYPETDIVVTQEELRSLFAKAQKRE
ncbi:MAG: hypothetical protein HYY92_03390 [Parcubacteria group bacterium]|nr:hypothetical protein [Parcubacteria group bacterium]